MLDTSLQTILLSRALGLAGNRNNLMFDVASSGRQVGNAIKKQMGAIGIRNPRARYVNWYVSTGSIEIPGAAPVLVAASIETPDGVRHQLTYRGQPFWVVPPDVVYIETDPCPIVLWPWSTYKLRTWADFGSGFFKIYGTQASVALDTFQDGGTVGNNTIGTGEWSTSGFSAVYTAPMVVGERMGSGGGGLLVGDSIGYGKAENSASGGDQYGNHGYLERLFNPLGYPMMNLSVSGTRASTWGTAGNCVRRKALVTGVDVSDYYLGELGTNDLTAGSTAAAVVNAITAADAQFAFCGFKRKYRPTITPHTNGANTAPFDVTIEPRRVSVNGTIRTGRFGTPMDAAALASPIGSPDGPLWRFDTDTQDGLHPEMDCIIRIASGLPTPATV